MRLRLDSSRADRRGVLVASICFVHCIAGPILLTLAGLTSLVRISERLEPLFLVSSAVLGVTALVPAYRKKHGRMSCIGLFAAGFLCLLMRHRVEARASSFELAATGVGAGLIIGAHLLNLRYSRHCPCCAGDSEPAGEIGRAPN